jgi:hypothetical protein
VTRRDPYAVLGLEPGASPTQVKAAWRRLAREHHPDVSGGDPDATRRSTRRMAEINAAYEKLRTGAGGVEDGRTTGRGAAPGTAPTAGRRSGPPPPPRTRPVTGRLDTTQTVRPRNTTTSRSYGRHPLSGQFVRRADRPAREAPRASDPTGPLERSRIRRFRRPPDPPLAAAAAHELEFGKFRGHTLGEVAAFEPYYIDWLARTIDHDRDLVASARVIKSDLDARGVVRRERPPTITQQRARSAGSAAG